MLEGLLQMEGGDQILPFVRCFFGSINISMGRRDGSHRASHKGREGSKEDPSCQCYLLTQGSCSDPGKDEAWRTRDGVLG